VAQQVRRDRNILRNAVAEEVRPDIADACVVRHEPHSAGCSGDELVIAVDEMSNPSAQGRGRAEDQSPQYGSRTGK
jgi:hypothetical protein